jgi:hypothetical protein
VRQQRADQAQARREKIEEERIQSLSQQKRLEVYQTLIPKLEQYTSDRQLEPEDWLTYQGLMKFHKHRTGNIPLASTAVKNLELKLKEAILSLQKVVKQNKFQQIQEDQTIVGNKLNFSSDLKNVKSNPKTPVGKAQASDKERSTSPIQAIEGMISHNNLSTARK